MHPSPSILLLFERTERRRERRQRRQTSSRHRPDRRNVESGAPKCFIRETKRAIREPQDLCLQQEEPDSGFVSDELKWLLTDACELRVCPAFYDFSMGFQNHLSPFAHILDFIQR